MIKIHRMYRAGFGEAPTLVAGVADGDAAQADIVGDKEQRAQMLVHLTALDRALPPWRESGRSVDAAAVTAALNDVNAGLATHLTDEEEHIVPVMERVLTQREVDTAGEHGRRAIPRGKTFAQLGAILAAQPDGVRE